MKKEPKKYLIRDTIIIDEIYPIIEEKMKTREQALKSCIGRFTQKRHDSLYDYAPVDRIFFKKNDADDFFKSTTIDQKEINAIMQKLYYYNEKESLVCKDDFSMACFMTFRYFLINKPNDKNKMYELVAMYLAFSGQFYAVNHHNYWHITPKREVMDYVINYMLSQKYDIIRTGSVWGMMNSLVTTWIAAYRDELVGEITDERIVVIIKQLNSRIGSALRNIANKYYDAYKNKLYLNKESDNFSEDGFRVVNNNSTIASSITEKTMLYISNSQVNIATCMAVSGSGVDPYEIKSIFENILNDNKKLSDLATVINILITDFMSEYPNEKDITGAKFIAHSMAMKPNTKNKDIIMMKNTIIGWLNASDRYQSIKTQATKNNYFKAILGYIAITVNTANKNK